MTNVKRINHRKLLKQKRLFKSEMLNGEKKINQIPFEFRALTPDYYDIAFECSKEKSNAWRLLRSDMTEEHTEAQAKVLFALYKKYDERWREEYHAWEEMRIKKQQEEIDEWEREDEEIKKERAELNHNSISKAILYCIKLILRGYYAHSGVCKSKAAQSGKNYFYKK